MTLLSIGEMLSRDCETLKAELKIKPLHQGMCELLTSGAVGRSIESRWAGRLRSPYFHPNQAVRRR
jgi:hypothetical protein